MHWSRKPAAGNRSEVQILSIPLMRYLLVLLLAFVGCTRVIEVERPTTNLPISLRQENWIGSAGQGSCVFATCVSLLRWEGQYDLADKIRNECGNGAGPDTLDNVLDQYGIQYAEELQGDVRFLEWTVATRRGAGVIVDGGKHCVALVYLDAEWAVILDNNQTDSYIWVARDKFLKEWREAGGWAFAFIQGSPAAPLPQRTSK